MAPIIVSKRLLAVCLLLVGACSGSGDASSTTAQPATTTSTTAVSTGVSDGCAVGSWILDLDSFVASFDATLRATGRTPDVSVSSGSATITFEENGHVMGVFEDLTVQTSFGEDPSYVTILAGDIIGTWSTQEGALVLAPDRQLTTFEASTPLEVTPDVPDSGVVYYEMPPDLNVVARSFPLPIMSADSTSSTRSIITCEADTLTIGLERGRSATVWLRS